MLDTQLLSYARSEVLVSDFLRMAEVARTWLDSALDKARTARQRRAAHLLHDCAIVTYGLRYAADSVRALFLPLSFFELEDWPEQRRKRLIADIETLITELRPVSQVRVALASLEAVLPELDFDSVQDVWSVYENGMIAINAARDVTGQRDYDPEDESDLAWNINPDGSRSMTLWHERYSEYFGAASVLPSLRTVFRDATIDHQRVRELAELALTTDLDKCAIQAEIGLGRLTGRLRREVPELPSANWAQTFAAPTPPLAAG